KKLVPARELRLRPLDLDSDFWMPARQMPNLRGRDQMMRVGSRQQPHGGSGVGAIQFGDELTQAEPPQMGDGIGDVDGDIDASMALDLESVAQAAKLVAPGFDGEEVPADAPRH